MKEFHMSKWPANTSGEDVNHGNSNPTAGSNFVGNKKGIVPRPKGDYLQAGVECDENCESNKIEKIADAPTVHDREHAEPKSAVDTLHKSATHGHNYPGRPYPKTGTKTGL
jgi:hypothetical protein